MSRIRLVPVILIVVISFAVLFGGWQAYQRFNLVNPLKKDLQQVQGVKSVDLDTGNPDVIHVQLGAISDLQTTYTEITNTVTGALGDSTRVFISDNHNKELTDALEDFQPMLLEGLAKGNYTEMISAVVDKAAKQNIQARITMDQHNVYVQLSKDSHYLYYVQPYTLHQGGASS